MQCCKFCGSKKIVKSGFTQSKKQRFSCKDCNKTFCENPSKYSTEFKLECVHFYLRNGGIRAIAEVKKIPHSLLIYWIKKSAMIAKEKIRENLEKIEPQDIEVLEIDELVTYIKKNLVKPEKNGENTLIFGMLSTEISTKLLILR